MIAAGGRLGRPEVEAIHNGGIARNHPFADGNKRTAAACMAAYLRINGVRFKPRHDELYDAMVGVAEGTWGFEELAAWVEGNVPAGAGGM